jgi:hypothetical protein
MSQAAFASDTALIVQGLLIFSAAVVGVIGYYVQSKLAAKARQRELLIARQEHLRQLELSRIREKLDTFIGPVSFLQHSFSGQLLGTVQVRMGEFFPQEHAQHKALFKEKGGWPAAFQGKAKFALMDGIYFGEAGASVSRQLTSAPDSEAAQLYRQVMRRLVLDYAVPLADLIKAYGGHLQVDDGRRIQTIVPVLGGEPARTQPLFPRVPELCVRVSRFGDHAVGHGKLCTSMAIFYALPLCHVDLRVANDHAHSDEGERLWYRQPCRHAGGRRCKVSVILYCQEKVIER